MKNSHETADGKFILLSDLSDQHLANIIAMIERKAAEGIVVMRGGGHGDIEEMWFDSEELEGKEVLDHFNLSKYKKEQKRRTETNKEDGNQDQ